MDRYLNERIKNMITAFSELNLPDAISQALTAMKFDTPTPIQAKAIPMALEGRDILGTAQTGTGKTAAFCIPMIARLMKMPGSKALILTPTRELAAQVSEAVKQLTQKTRLSHTLLIGGDPIHRQISALRRDPEIIVGTPGRITDHLDRGTLMLHTVNFLVLDETDRMLEMGFCDQIDRILKFLTGKKQTLMFSATLPQAILKLTEKYLKDPVRVTVGSVNKPAQQISQKTVKVNESEKYGCLTNELDNRDGSIIIFAKTKRGTENIARKLYNQDYSVAFLHGSLQQRKRERVISDFRSQKYKILVATDIAARGIDIPHVEHVINFDMPQSPQDYVHRIGRTGRAGLEGAAFNILCQRDVGKWNAIERMLKLGSDTPSGRSDRRPGRGAPSDNFKRRGGKSFPVRGEGGRSQFTRKKRQAA